MMPTLPSSQSPCTVGGVSATSRSLSEILFTRAAIAVGGGLLTYAGFELIFDPPNDLLNFMTHHFAHVVIVGFAVWFVCWLALCENVLHPVHAIARHLSRIRKGRFEKLAYRSANAEMEIIIDGINQLVERLQTGGSDDLTAALTAVQELRVRLGGLAVTDAERKVPVMRSLTRLESSLLNLMCHADTSKV